MLNTNKTQKLYAEVIFLDYIGKHTPDTEYDYPNYLKEELDVSDTNLFVGIHPRLLINRFFPTKPSDVQTMLNGRGYSTVAAIFKSIKLE